MNNGKRAKSFFATSIWAVLATCVLHLDVCTEPCLSDTANVAAKFDDKWAVVIGVGDFTEAGWTIKYATKDATDIRSYLIEHANFKSDHVRDLIGSHSTQANVLRSIEWLGAVARPGDLAVIYIRTRGTYPSLDAAGKRYFALSDTTAATLAKTGIEMAGFVDKVLMKVHSKAIAIIVDSDFAENSFQMGSPELPDEKIFPADHTLVVACSTFDDQICWESERLHNSVFTHALLEALASPKASGSLLEALSKANANIPLEMQQIRPNRSQDMQAAGLTRGCECFDVDLAVPPTRPRKAP